MALLFCDGFDHYTSIGAKWGLPFTNSGTITAGVGRFGTAGHRLTGSTNSGGGIAYTLPAAVTTLICGLAFNDFSSGLTLGILGFMQGGTHQIGVLFNQTTQQLSVIRGGNAHLVGGTTLATGAVVPAGYIQIEFKATINNSTGSYELKLNGDTYLSATGVDTQTTATASIDQIQSRGSTTNGVGFDIDDVYVCDTTGSVNNDFLGDVRVSTIFPNGNGNTSQLVGQDANSTDNYLLVDEAAPDSDTTYVESSTVGEKDTYAFSNTASASGTVHGIQIIPFAKKTDAGTRKINTIARHSGTEEDSADITLLTGYTYHPNIRETKPGGGAWSTSDVNGAEFGVKVAA